MKTMSGVPGHTDVLFRDWYEIFAYTPVKIAFGVDKINNKLNFCMELGNIVGDHLPKVPKNPLPASWDIAKKQNGRQQ